MELEKIEVKEVDEIEVRVMEKEVEVEVKNFFINFIK